MKISKFYEDNNLMIRAAKVARMSWDSEHKSDSTPEGLGEADLKLAVKLMKAGSDHSAAFRQVVVWFEMSASRGFYQHFAKYRHGVEMYSTSLIQRRAIMLSYPAMRSIYASRSKHRKPEWREFLEQLLELMDYPELITT